MVGVIAHLSFAGNQWRGGGMRCIECLLVITHARGSNLERLLISAVPVSQKCSTMSPGNPFIFWSDGQRSRSRVTKH